MTLRVPQSVDVHKQDNMYCSYLTSNSRCNQSCVQSDANKTCQNNGFFWGKRKCSQTSSSCNLECSTLGFCNLMCSDDVIGVVSLRDFGYHLSEEILCFDRTKTSVDCDNGGRGCEFTAGNLYFNGMMGLSCDERVTAYKEGQVVIGCSCTLCECKVRRKCRNKSLICDCSVTKKKPIRITTSVPTRMTSTAYQTTTTRTTLDTSTSSQSTATPVYTTSTVFTSQNSTEILIPTSREQPQSHQLESAIGGAVVALLLVILLIFSFLKRHKIRQFMVRQRKHSRTSFSVMNVSYQHEVLPTHDQFALDNGVVQSDASSGNLYESMEVCTGNNYINVKVNRENASAQTHKTSPETKPSTQPCLKASYPNSSKENTDDTLHDENKNNANLYSEINLSAASATKHRDKEGRLCEKTNLLDTSKTQKTYENSEMIESDILVGQEFNNEIDPYFNMTTEGSTDYCAMKSPSAVLNEDRYSFVRNPSTSIDRDCYSFARNPSVSMDRDCYSFVRNPSVSMDRDWGASSVIVEEKDEKINGKTCAAKVDEIVESEKNSRHAYQNVRCKSTGIHMKMQNNIEEDDVESNSIPNNDTSDQYQNVKVTYNTKSDNDNVYYNT